jgi:phosphoglycolate phosphatase-like HAD superfamily hydrolase
VTRVLCWDVDGTLLTTARAGMIAWEDALAEAADRRIDLADFRTAGATDVEIAGRLLGHAGLAPTPARQASLLARYEALLPERLGQRRGEVLPGVREILERLRGEPGMLVLLLTGNTRAGARAKLHHYGLEGYFAGGAFADGCPDRPSIARKAVDVAGQLLGGPPLPGSIFVIGDTPHDIACAHAIGARAIAVATGAYAVGELERHAPWWALDRLPPPDAFLDRLAAR